MAVRKIAVLKEVSEAPEERNDLKRRYILPVASRTPNPEHNFFSFHLILFNNPILQVARTSLSPTAVILDQD